jgi:hypothetical protein
MLGFASRALGATVHGADAEASSLAASDRSSMARFLGGLDVILNGGVGSAAGQAGMGAKLVQSVVGGSNGMIRRLTQDPIAMTSIAQSRVNSIALHERNLSQQLAAARERAARGDTAAAQEVVLLEGQVRSASLLRLGEQVSGAREYEQSVASSFALHFGERASGFESLLDLGRPLNILDQVRMASTPESRARLSAQLETAVHVAEARLGTLRAEIQYLQHLVDTGQLTPEQEARLTQLGQQYEGMQQRLQVVEQARHDFQQYNRASLRTKAREYRALDERTDQLVAMQIDITGQTRDGRVVDLATLSPAERRAVLDGERVAIRAATRQAVEHGDFSAVDRYERLMLDTWLRWQAQDEVRRREAADREEELRVHERRDEARREQLKIDQNRHREYTAQADAFADHQAQVAIQRYRQWEQEQLMQHLAGREQRAG